MARLTDGRKHASGSAGAELCPEQPTAAELASLAGVDVMRAIAAGRLPAAPIAELANMRLAQVDEGHIVFEAEPRFAHYNPLS